MEPVCPKCSTPSGRTACPCTAPSQASVAGWPSSTDTIPQWAGISASSFSICELARALRGGPAGIEPVGGGDGKEPDVAPVLRDQADRLYGLRRDRPGIGDDDLTIWSRPAQPIGAVDDGLAQLRRHGALDLLDRARR